MTDLERALCIDALAQACGDVNCPYSGVHLREHVAQLLPHLRVIEGVVRVVRPDAPDVIRTRMDEPISVRDLVIQAHNNRADFPGFAWKVNPVY